MKKEIRVRANLIFVIIIMTGFISLEYIKNLSPQEVIVRIYDKLIKVNNNNVKNLFPSGNYGLINQLNEKVIKQEAVTVEDIKKVFGIHWDADNGYSVDYKINKSSDMDGISYSEGVFTSYDGVEIPFYEIYPKEFNNSSIFPAVILYSGHGNMDQVAFEKDSYQKGIGLDLAKQGFIVYVMENRGMGKLSSLGDHLRIDAVARMMGGSWYGEITTDALYFLDFVFSREYTSESIGVGGVSTGGALSLLTGAIDKRVVSVYVQGYLGSYATTFGTRGSHCICNNISNIINEFDMGDIANQIYPRSVIYVNGKEDAFYAADAITAFKSIEKYYTQDGLGNKVSLKTPEKTKHEISIPIALDFFSVTLMREQKNFK